MDRRLADSDSDTDDRCREALINEGAGVNIPDQHGRTPSISAASKGHAQCVNQLNKAGPDVNVSDRYGLTLIFAVEQDRLDRVNELITAGADVNAVHDGYTALILAAREGMTKYAELLIEAGADVNMKDRRSQDALFYAAKNKDNIFMEILLKSGADVNSRYGYGEFPLLEAVQQPLVHFHKYDWQQKRLACINMLIKAGADVNAKTSYSKKTALMSVAGDTKVMNILIKAGANVNAKSTCGDSALLRTTMFCSVDSMKPLLEAGADVNAENIHGITVLWYGAVFIDRLKLLLKAGADVNTGQNKDHGTALMRASHSGNHECVDALLAAGADVNARDKSGRNALHRLADEPHRHYENHIKCARKLLKAGIHINRFPKSEGKNALGETLGHDNRQLEGVAESYRDLLMLLYAAGETLDGSDVEKIPEELKFEDEKLQLKHICREAIRKHLLKLDPHQHLFGRVRELGLPSSLTSYMLFHTSLDDDDDDDDDNDDDDDDNECYSLFFPCCVCLRK